MAKALFCLFLLVPDAADETFTIRGRVKLDGPIPPVKLNKLLGNDPSCCNLHLVVPPKDDLIVDPQGGVRWAFVYIKTGLEGRQFAIPADPLLIDQVGCTYAPHVSGAMVGQVVKYRNSDPQLHNVHGLPFANKEFNFGQPKGTVNEVKFLAQEVMVKVKCEVHPFMGSWIGVLEHPFYAVTDAMGKFEIKNLPAGKYRISVWHEGIKFEDQEIVVKGDHTADFVGTLK
jgi:hypothetical protein